MLHLFVHSRPERDNPDHTMTEICCSREPSHKGVHVSQHFLHGRRKAVIWHPCVDFCREFSTWSSCSCHPTATKKLSWSEINPIISKKINHPFKTFQLYKFLKETKTSISAVMFKSLINNRLCTQYSTIALTTIPSSIICNKYASIWKIIPILRK